MRITLGTCRQDCITMRIRLAVTLLFGMLALAVAIVPSEAWIAASRILVPDLSPQPKTMWLLNQLRLVLPALGAGLVTWPLVPDAWRVRAEASLKGSVLTSPWLLPALVLIAMAIAIAWILYVPTRPYADSQWYYEKAIDLSLGRGYVMDLETHRPTAAWPVGYPAFLALLFLWTSPSLTGAKLANVALLGLATYLTYYVGRRFFSHSTGVLSAFLLLLLPGLFAYSAILNSDLLFTTLLLSILSLALGNPRSPQSAFWRALLAGLLNGFLALTRSAGLALIPLWIFIYWRAGHRETREIRIWVAALVLGTGVVVAPWTLRNYVVFHKVIPVSTNDGTNMWMGNNPEANGGFYWPRDPAANPLIQLVTTNEVAAEELGRQLAIDYIRHNPGRALELLRAKLFYLYNSNDAGLGWLVRSAVQPASVPWDVLVGWANLTYTTLAYLALMGLVLAAVGQPRNPIPSLLALVAVCWTILLLPFFGSDRFVLPLLPFIPVFAAWSLWSVFTIRVASGPLAFLKMGEKPVTAAETSPVGERN